AGSIYDSPQFAAAARRLHTREPGGGTHLDVSATLDATVESHGYPLLRYRPDTRPSEYLVLIDRTSASDHQAALFAQLADALCRQGLYVHQLFFDGDPRICWSAGLNEDIRLADLQSKFGEYRLLL